MLLPPLFKFCSMFVTQCLDERVVWSQLRRVGFAGQDRRAEDVAAFGSDKTDEIGQSATLPYKVIHEEVQTLWLYFTDKDGLMGQSFKTAGASVPHGIGLDDRSVDR